MRRRDATRGNLEVLILRVLVGGPLHGYGVIAALKQRSDGVFDLPEGTVYPSLHRLEDAGLLASDWEVTGGRRRRSYRLTAEGARRLTAGRQDWARFAGGMNLVLGGAG